MATRAQPGARGVPQMGGKRSGGRLRLLKRRRWTNHTGNQGVDPVAVLPLSSADEVAQAVLAARGEGLTIRAVGSGHSWSDVALTTGYLVLPDGLRHVTPVDPGELRDGVDPASLVSVGAGTTIREINDALNSQGRALIQMGGYDGQRIAGVVSTSTHGSGLGFGPFCDFVRSVDLVDGSGTKWRIEPDDGPTEEAAFRSSHPGWEFHRGNTWFEAVICGMGSVGLILSLVLEVREAYRLTERRELSTWKDVRGDLELGAVLLDNEHYEVYLNPYTGRCLVTTRNTAEPGSGASWRARHRPVIPELLSSVPWFTGRLLRWAVELRPQWAPKLLDMALKGIEDREYTNASYRVYNIGAANNMRAYSSELGVPLAGGNHIEAVDRIIAVADRYRRDGAIYHTSPIALRFVARSRAPMSMMHAGPTMMIELIQMVDTDGGFEILAAYEEALADLDARPHWGQVNVLAANGRVEQLYDRLAEWQSVRRELDPDDVFASPFTKRVGITQRGFGSRAAPAAPGPR